MKQYLVEPLVADQEPDCKRPVVLPVNSIVADSHIPHFSEAETEPSRYSRCVLHLVTVGPLNHLFGG